jgi:hypothetical protein
MARRKRSDSTESAVAAMQAAVTKIEPPAYVGIMSEALPFWYDIVNTRHIDSWTPNDLIMAGTLAQVYYDIQKYTAIVNKNSRLIKDNQDQVKVSPMHKVLVDLVAQAQSLARTLQVHARATQGESREQKNRNAVFYEAKRITQGDDDLLAKPRH